MADCLLVTGAAGFIGANFVHYWLREHPDDRVIAYDALTYAGNLANLAALMDDPRFRFVKGDIRDEVLVTQLLRDEQVTRLVHFAAERFADAMLGDEAREGMAAFGDKRPTKWSVADAGGAS